MGALRFAIIDNNGYTLKSYDSGAELLAELSRAVSSQYALLGLRPKKRAQLEAEVNDLHARILKELGLETMRL